MLPDCTEENSPFASVSRETIHPDAGDPVRGEQGIGRIKYLVEEALPGPTEQNCKCLIETIAGKK